MTPEGWRSAELGAIAQVNPEQLKHRTDPDYVLEYLDIAAIERPGVIGASRTLTLADAPSRARRRARAGDILVSTVRPYLRNFARVGEAPSNLVASTGYAVVRPANGVDGRFLYQHVLSDAFVEFLKPRMRGSNYPAVKADDVKTYTLSLPPLPEQRKIAAILSSVDDAIEKTQAVIDQVQVVKRGLMQELLTRGLPGRHTRFKQTEVGEIPEEWSLSLLSDVVFFLEGPGLRKWLFRDRGMPFINIRCIRNDGTLDLSSVQYIAEDKAQNSYRHFFLEANDTVLSSSGTLGRMAVVREADLPLMLNTSVIRFRTLNDDVCATSYMRAFLSSEIFLNQVLRESQGSAQANFGPTHLRKVKIPLPPVAEQKVLSAAFTAPSERLMAERTKKKCLAKLKSALMSVLLTGELRVTPDPEIA